MARAVGLFEAGDEALLAACEARLGNPDPARRLFASRISESDDLSLAELYVPLGENEKAREHALLAYKDAWGEGEPYANQSALQYCRRVLAEIGEPEPKLPPFDPSTAPPVKFEVELRAHIDRKRKEKSEQPPSSS